MKRVILKTIIILGMLLLDVINCDADCTLTIEKEVLFQIGKIAGNNEVICLNRTETEISEKHVVALEGAFLITCTAREATEFFFEGDMMSPSMDIFVTRFWPHNQKTFRAGGGIYQTNTGRYGCSLTRDQTFNNSVYLYVADASPPYILQSGSTLDVYSEEATLFFPCKSSNPFISVHLYQITTENPNSERKLISGNDVLYDRTEGFFVEYSSPQIRNANSNFVKYFICAATNSNKDDYRLFKLHPRKGSMLTPAKEKFSVKYWEDLHLKCEYSKPQNLTWRFEGVLKNQSSLVTSGYERPDLNLKYVTELFIGGGALKNISTINVTCRSFPDVVNNNRRQSQLPFSFTWQIEISSDGMHPDDLKLNLESAAAPIQCASSLATPKLSLISCTNRVQCDFRKICLLKDVCPMITKVIGRKCWQPNCTMLVSPPDSGIILCSVNDTQKIVQFYKGFDGNRYSVDSPVPPTVLLKLDKIVEKIHTQEYFIASCNGIGFVVSQEITWGFVYRNGTISFLEEKQDFNDTEEGEQLESISRTSSIFIDSTDVIQLICMVPLINSTEDWINITMDINVHESSPPTIVEKKSKLTFYTGDTNMNLICSATGNPPPTITWERYGQNNSDYEPLLTLKNEKGQAVLRFPTANESYNGEYICKATNFRGSVQQIFTLNVEDAVASGIDKRTSIGLGIGVTLVILVLVFGLTIQFRALRKSRKLLRSLTTAEVDKFVQGYDSALFGGTSIPHQYEKDMDPLSLPYNTKYEVDKDLLEMKGKLLGSGAYGKVIRGKLTQSDGTAKEVAIKSVSPNADVVYFKALLSELKIMTFIGIHSNIVLLEGAYTKEIKDRIIYLVIEICENGSLETYLRNHRSQYVKNPRVPASTPDDHQQTAKVATDQRTNEAFKTESITFNNLCEWAMQTAEGMDYLAAKKIVHGDLAARNILLTKDLIVKITDFGLSKQLYEDNLYKKKKQVPLPWKWLSVELLKDMIFSTESDVWAYGVTLWEMFSLGEVPFPGVSFSAKFLKDLVAGERMECPRYATTTIYDALLMTWDIEPSNRPTFKSLSKLFEDILNHETNEVSYVELEVEETK